MLPFHGLHQDTSQPFPSDYYVSRTVGVAHVACSSRQERVRRRVAKSRESGLLFHPRNQNVKQRLHLLATERRLNAFRTDCTPVRGHIT